MDYDYLLRRMTEERQRAAEADTDAARDAHMALAAQYQAQLDELRGGGGEERPELGLAGH